MLTAIFKIKSIISPPEPNSWGAGELFGHLCHNYFHHYHLRRKLRGEKFVQPTPLPAALRFGSVSRIKPSESKATSTATVRRLVCSRATAWTLDVASPGREKRSRALDPPVFERTARAWAAHVNRIYTMAWRLRIRRAENGRFLWP